MSDADWLIFSGGDIHAGFFKGGCLWIRKGSADSKEDWLNEKVADWSEAIETLAKIAVQYPQTAYAGFVSCLQEEYQYVSCVVKDTAVSFQPLEVCTWEYFCPVFNGIGAHEIDGKYRELILHSVEKGAWQYTARWIRLCTCMLPQRLQ